jgi:pimeloyl-ACP methyl ester carboxylesterase
VPLLLIHGFPCTSLIWSHNVGPLAEAGFDVAAPDLRGYGESDFAPDSFYDLAAFSADLAELLDALGWERVVVVAHDLGAAITMDFANRFAARVDRVVLLDGTTPDLPEAYAAAGIPTASGPMPVHFDYRLNQGRYADDLLDQLNTPERRRRYIGEFFGHRLWSPAGAFTDDDRDLLTAAYADADRLRAAFADYEVVMGERAVSAPAIEDQPVRQPTMVLVGTDAATLGASVEERCAVAYPELVGPFWIKNAGHFLCWEKPSLVNRAVRSFCADLLAQK